MITATYNSVSRSATLTVNPSSGGPLPRLSWLAPAAEARFAPGHKHYVRLDRCYGRGHIHYPDRRPGPVSRLKSIRQSDRHYIAISTSTLPTETMWFRARANDASGNPGNWSAIRRFEVKD